MPLFEKINNFVVCIAYKSDAMRQGRCIIGIPAACAVRPQQVKTTRRQARTHCQCDKCFNAEC